MIIVDTSRASGRKFLAGAERYISGMADWEVHIQPPDYLHRRSSGRDFGLPIEKMDGLLIRDAVSTVPMMTMDIPKVINDTQRELIPGSSTIVTDSYAIGKMAAEYFLDLGFYNFAYCGFRGLQWSEKRANGFASVLKENSVSKLFEYKDDFSGTQQSSTERWKISEWLKQLPRPLCVFACNDDRALYILEACKIAGFSVPEEVAVLGVDNDELVCNLSSPSMSSIELDFERAGFWAAQHLNQLILKLTDNQTIQVVPVEIIERRSTDVLAISDEFVVAALIFIRSNFHRPIQAIDVVNAAGLSRRELEKRFKKYLNKTIKGEIERLRIELIKKKLLNNSQSIYQIAGELEFTDPEHFSRYFKNATGQTPSQFRRKF